MTRLNGRLYQIHLYHNAARPRERIEPLTGLYYVRAPMRR